MKQIRFTLLLLLPFLYSCKQSVNEAVYKGTWIDKNLLAGKNSNSSFATDTLARFPLILFEKEQEDSVLFYYNQDKQGVYKSQYAYDSYFFHFDKHNEYFLAYDYSNDEMIFSNLKDDEFYRFVKVDTLLRRNDVLHPEFDLEEFLSTLQ